MCTIAFNLHLTGRKVQIKSTIFCLAWCFCLGRRRRVLRTLIRTAPDSQDGQKKPPVTSQKFASDSQKGSNKIRETTRFFGSALRFCWVGGVECFELFYVRHLTVRRVKIKATSHKKGFHLYHTSLGVTPEAKTCSAAKCPTSEETGCHLFFHSSGSTSILVSGCHTGKL